MMDLRYPIGQFALKSEPTDVQLQKFIEEIAEAPAKLRDAVRGLSDEQLNTPYREGGWMVRQVAHHLPDSHLNAYARFRMALTEHEPEIKPYNEARWAELDDARNAPVETSLVLLEALHERWVLLLKSLTPEEFKRAFRHSESGLMMLDKIAGMYAWHGRHHVAQITELRRRMNWD